MKSFGKLAAAATFASLALGSVAAAQAQAAPQSSSLASAQALPPATEIIAKHVAAIGGRDAIAKISAMRQKGTMELPGGLSGTVELAIASPDKMVMRNTIPSIGEMLQGYDGTTAWSMNPLQGPRVITGAELEQAKEAADLSGGLLYAPERYGNMQTVGVVDFAGEKAYKVRMTYKASGTETYQYFSVANGWNIGSERTQQSDMGTLQVVTRVGGYRQYGAVKVATRSEMAMGPTTLVITFNDVSFEPVPASTFDLPDAVKALVRK